MMRRIIVGTAVLIGIALAGAPALAQPGSGGGQQTDANRGSYGGGDSQGSYGQTSGGQGSYGQDRGSYDQASYGQQTSQGDYAQGSYGQQAYAPEGRSRCRFEDDHESRRCHHRLRSRGWYRESESEAYYRGDHYRGYQDDGTGRRSYDRGGYGVGHDDYTRDYDPLRGY